MAEPPPVPFLKFEEEDGREIRLSSGNVWKIGRSEQNAIALVDDIVSRNHAMIQQMEDGEFYLIDMGSRNGSFVNGNRVTAPAVLRDGDHLSFGTSRLCFHNAAQAAAASTTVDGRHGETVALFRPATVSVLVVDIREFTVLAQKVDPEVLGKLVSTWFAEADRIMRHNGSTAEKHIGDAVMAVWTHGAKGQEHIEVLRVLRAVAEIAQVTSMLHESFRLTEPVRIGAGVNTGLAAIGNTGAGAVSDFTAIGDSVNAAFRLESATKELLTDLVLGDSTFDYLRAWPTAVRRFRTSEARLKGYNASVKTWHILFPELKELLLECPGNLVKTTTELEAQRDF